MSSRKPADGLAHDRLWPLIANAQPTNSHNIFEGKIFTSTTFLHPHEKGRPPFKPTVYFYLLSRNCDANFTTFTYSLHSVNLSVHLAHSRRSHINLTTSGFRSAYTHTHIYIYIYLSLYIYIYIHLPNEINLCPMLPRHFLLHTKSLLGPTLRAPPKPEAGIRPLPSQVLFIRQRRCCELAACELAVRVVGAGRWLCMWWRQGAGCSVPGAGAGYRCWALVLGAVSWRAGARCWCPLPTVK